MSSASHIKHLPLAAAVPVINLYAYPSHDAEVISQSIYGSNLHLLSTHGAWLKVSGDDSYPGWALNQYFLRRNPNPTPEVHVSQLSANIYREPDVKVHAPLLHLPWGTCLEPCPDLANLNDPHSRWLPVRLLTDQIAFVLRGDVAPPAPPLSPEQMLALAHRFLGITYTWGGLSSFGFDCSGFVQILHRQRGILLPRDAQAQCDWPGFLEVPREHLLPADLLFFTEHAPTITHVGLCLDAETFIHATTEGHPGVQISRLADEPWHTRLYAQRRLRP